MADIEIPTNVFTNDFVTCNLPTFYTNPNPLLIVATSMYNKPIKSVLNKPI
jgi:hypothetical protein